MYTKYNEKYTREVLSEAVANSISVAGVLRYLEIPLAGGTHAHISRKLKQLGIDTSHFKRVAPNRGKPSARRLTPEQILLCAHQAHHGQRRTCCAGHCARPACRTSAGRAEWNLNGTQSR